MIFILRLQGKGEIQPLTVQAPQNFGMPILMLHRNETVWNDPAVSFLLLWCILFNDFW